MGYDTPQTISVLTKAECHWTRHLINIDKPESRSGKKFMFQCDGDNTLVSEYLATAASITALLGQ